MEFFEDMRLVKNSCEINIIKFYLKLFTQLMRDKEFYFISISLNKMNNYKFINCNY